MRPGVLLSSPLQRFELRSTRRNAGDSVTIDLRVAEYTQRLEAHRELQAEIDRFRAGSTGLDKFPTDPAFRSCDHWRIPAGKIPRYRFPGHSLSTANNVPQCVRVLRSDERAVLVSRGLR